MKLHFGKEKEWKDGKYVETGKDKIINNTKPAWTLKPADLKDEDYHEVLQGALSGQVMNLYSIFTLMLITLSSLPVFSIFRR